MSALSETPACLVSAQRLDPWDLSATRRASVPAGDDCLRPDLRTDDKSKWLDTLDIVWYLDQRSNLMQAALVRTAL